ncbi:MAG: nuclear transport factor 2 family protein [Proteobacteria bacterium]|nr:nuclear transport factor 2 family protein [Pseudomonadota bacterium]
MKSPLRELKHPIAGLTLGCCIAASSVATEQRSPQTAPPTDARQELLNLENEWAAAEDKHDEAILRRVLDERFVGTFSSGKTYDKEAFIKAILAAKVNPNDSPQTLSYEAVIIDGDTAVLVGTDTRHGTRDGAAYTAVAKYTVTYLHRNGRWMALAEQLFNVPQAK